jgi:hypothetical protein
VGRRRRQKKKAAAQHVDDASGVTNTTSSTKGGQEKKANKKKKAATQHVDEASGVTSATSSTKGGHAKKAKKEAAVDVWPPLVDGVWENTVWGINTDRWVKKLIVADDKNPVRHKVGAVPVVYSKVLLPPGVTKLNMSHFYTQEQIAFRKNFASSAYSQARKSALQMGCTAEVAIKAAQLVHRETVLRYDMGHIFLTDVLQYTLRQMSETVHAVF